MKIAIPTSYAFLTSNPVNEVKIFRLAQAGVSRGVFLLLELLYGRWLSIVLTRLGRGDVNWKNP